MVTDADRAYVRELFDRHVEVGLHHGAQLAVHDGTNLVVDCAGGTTGPDGDATTPTTRHVLFSCTKPYAGAALHRLVERAEVAYDDPVVEHWPEFADAGTPKATITVRDVLGHTAGIPSGEFDTRPEEWGDWEAAVAAMEAIEPVYEPGERAAYHPVNYGWLVGELVRRVGGRPIRAYAAEHVFEPLGMDDTAIGLADDEPDDVAALHGFEPFDRCREPGEGLGGTPAEAAARFNRASIRRAVIPAANGVGTARDMARFYACIANGGSLDGTRVLAESTVEEALALHAETDEDGTLGRPSRYALGFQKGGRATDRFGHPSRERQFGHGGLGSSFGWGDPETGVGFAYVTNGIRDGSFEHPARVRDLVDAVRGVLG